MEFSMMASHARGKGTKPDAVFAVLKRANDAMAKYGKEKVVNATIGAIYDDDGKFVALSSVSEYYRKMADEEMMSYAPIAGIPEFLQAAIDYAFQGNQPENTYTAAVATPGGTGGIRHAFYNYLEQGDKALIPDWFWGPYKTIADEHLRGVETYKMFDEDYNFTLEDVKVKTGELLAAQDNVVVVFNTPGHNPTGYSMTDENWSEILEFFKTQVSDKQKKITVVVDMAYIDFVGSSQKTRNFMKLFGGLPENILITLAFSMSKSFTSYGMRSGALIAVSSSAEVVREFANGCQFSSRGVWSNGTRACQRLLADMMKDPQLKAKMDKEREQYSSLILKRADIFIKEAQEVGLKMLPYHGGFFITVPAADPKATAEKLEADNIFVVPLKKGIRFAVCALPTQQMSGLAAKTKAAL